MQGLSGGTWRVACALVFVAALAATLPTTGDIGLTWDEPAYRYSQEMSAQWWEGLASARSWGEASPYLEPDALLYYWPYGRHGINFHPPFAGQLNLATHALFGRWWQDTPSRRLATVLEYVLTITIGFGFLARRYGPWVGGVFAGSLLLMPRVYGDGHIAATDTPGLFLWAATTVAFWKGLYDAKGRRWRVLVGILMGLAFLEKVAAVIVLLPLLAWMVVGHLPRTFTKRGGKADWVDGVLTTGAMLIPLGAAFREILRLARQLPPPGNTNLFIARVPSDLPGVILVLPLVVWACRRLLGRVFRSSPIWGAERPALETFTAILAFAPIVGWLGNPAWWREALPRLAHYYMLSTARRGALPDIQILYLGQIYEYSLPWHNAWVLLAITVPAGILFAGVAGLVYTLRSVRRDRLPLYFLAHFLTLPALRMLATPAHDGVRLFLPTFFFLAAFAGWGLVWVADGLARLVRGRPAWTRGVLATLVLGSAAWQLVKVHPFELSYYNELIGGAKGAWKAGFELSYWYDAFNDRTLDALNRKFPKEAAVDFYNQKSMPPTFGDLQALGKLRGDVLLGTRKWDALAFAWLLTQDSKAWTITRLLFDMKPWYALEPRQLDGVRVATVADPVAVSRAWALQMLVESGEEWPIPPDDVPGWVQENAPWLGRFWGQGLTKVPLRKVYEPSFEWAKTAPDRLRAAARALAERKPIAEGSDEARLLAVMKRFDRPDQPGGNFSERLLYARPQSIVDAVEILITHPEAVRAVLGRYPYTDPSTVGGYLDRDLPDPPGRFESPKTSTRG